MVEFLVWLSFAGFVAILLTAIVAKIKFRRERKERMAKMEESARKWRHSADGVNLIQAPYLNLGRAMGAPQGRATTTRRESQPDSSSNALLYGAAGYMLGSSGNAQASDYTPSYSGSGGTSGGAGSSSSYDSCSSSSSSSSSSSDSGSSGGGGSD